MNAATVDVKIRASVQVDEMRKIEERIQREIVQLKALGGELNTIKVKEKELADIRSKIKGVPAADRAKGAFANAAGSIPGIGPIVQAFNGSALALAAGAAVASKAIGFLASSVREFAAAEVSVAKLDAALGNSGLLNGQYRSELQKLASELQGSTAIGDETWLDVFTTLTKFGADSSNIRQYSKAVENLAGMMGGDVTQAAFLFGKAMQGSTEMLGRYGIQVDKAKGQSEQLADIMRQLEMRGAGQLEGMGKTLAGRVRGIALAWGDVKEGIGQVTLKLTDLLAKAMGFKDTSTYLEKFAEGLAILAGTAGTKENTSGAENRAGTLVAKNPLDQAKADDLTQRRNSLLKAKETQQQLLAVALEENSKAAVMPRRTFEEDKAARAAGEQSQARIDTADRTIEGINKGLRDVENEARALGTREVRAGVADAALDATRVIENFEPVVAKDDDPTGLKAAEARRQAQKRREQEETTLAKLAERRAALEDDLALEEAKGDPAKLARLKWQQDYAKSLKEGQAAGMGDGAFNFAIRKANASVEDPQEDPQVRHQVSQSDLQRVGGAAGERATVFSQVLSEARKQTRTLEQIRDKEPVVIDGKARFEP